ncbi:MAG: ABC transporter ATP-binding protein [archaeon]
MLPLLKITHLTKSFNNNSVLKDIDIEIDSGKIFGIIGSSGSGKTTFLNCLIGFVTPDDGDVLYKIEKGMSEKYVSIFKNKKEMRHLFGFAAQNPSFYPELTVRENITYFGNLYSLSKDALKANTNTLLYFMDLMSAQHTLAKNLSGGMQRRLDIACSLIHDPKLLILDEPTADLDPLLRANIWKLIKQINKKGTTIVLASHHLNEIENICNRIAILKDGRILESGTPHEIRARFSNAEEIHIESFPGKYENIMKLRNKEALKYITHAENKGTKLIIYTTRPEKVLPEILNRLEDQKENLIDLRVNKPTLDEIFVTLAKGDQP